MGEDPRLMHQSAARSPSSSLSPSPSPAPTFASPLAPAPLPDDLSELLPPDEPVQLLDPAGERRTVEGYDAPSDAETLRATYRDLVLARRVDTQALNLSRQGRLAAYPTARGQEAVEVGAVRAMAEHDWLFPTYRETMAVVVRGVDVLDALRACQATTYYDYDFSEHRVASMAVPLATQAVHATGLAMAARLRDDPLAVLTFLGDGASSEGDAHEAMNFAGAFGAPVVFLVVNNQWAISTPATRQTNAPTLAHRAIGYGMPGTRVDGNDVLAVQAAVHRALERARSGGGPSVVEALTYRIEAHTASDDPSRYRSDAEVDHWRDRDPIDRFERYLRAEGVLDDDHAAEVETAADAVAARIRAWADEAPVLDPLTMFDHAYADATPALAAQRRVLAAELATEERP